MRRHLPHSLIQPYRMDGSVFDIDRTRFTEGLGKLWLGAVFGNMLCLVLQQ